MLTTFDEAARDWLLYGNVYLADDGLIVHPRAWQQLRDSAGWTWTIPAPERPPGGWLATRS